MYQSLNNNNEDILSLTGLLKKGTHQSHIHIEKNALMKSLFQSDFTCEKYIEVLTRMLGYYAPLEQRIEQYLSKSDVLDFTYVNKSSLIIKDLKNLGVHSDTLSMLPYTEALPEIKTDEALLGCIYVLEGATMGGQVISKHLLNILGEKATDSFSFYKCYGDKSLTHWKHVKNCIDLYTSNINIDAEAVVAFAIKTFDMLDEWLTLPEKIEH